jgi:hypothetical protein
MKAMRAWRGRVALLAGWMLLAGGGSHLSAQTLAPDSVVGMIYQATHEALPGLGDEYHEGVLSAGGTRRVAYPNTRDSQPGKNARYQWTKTGNDRGALALSASGTLLVMEIVFTAPLEGTYRQTMTGSTTVRTGRIRFTRLPADPQAPVANVATRATLRAGESVTVGFVVDGAAARRVLVRGVGPGLAAFAVGAGAATVELVVRRGGEDVGRNAVWGGGAALAEVFRSAGAFALPADSRDAALVLTLAPGAYTAQVRAGSDGEVMAEVYLVP